MCHFWQSCKKRVKKWKICLFQVNYHKASLSQSQLQQPVPSIKMATAYSVPQAADQQCLSRVELRVECRNLMNKDVMSKSDPCAVMFMSRGGNYMDEVCRHVHRCNCCPSVCPSVCLCVLVCLSYH